MKTDPRRWLKRTGLALMALLMFALAACEAIKNIDFPWDQPAGVPTKTPVLPTATPTVSPTPVLQTNTPTPTPVPAIKKLIVWLPPEFDPEGEGEAAKLLKARLEQFGNENRLEIVVRLKSDSGSSNIIESLLATNGAAPENLPSVVLMRKQEFDSSVARSLLYTNQELTDLASQVDWYSFARETVSYEGEMYGVGLFGDPMIMAYQGQTQLIPSNDWFQVHKNYGHFGFAADDSQSRFLLLLYVAAGGEVRDEQNHLILQEEPLTKAFQTIKDVVNTKHMSNLVLEMQTPKQVWQGFAEWKLNTAVMPASVVLDQLAHGSSGYPDPAFTQPEFTFSDAWIMALANPNEEKQELGMKLIRELTEPAFLAKWSEALTLVPARPTALGAWTNLSLKPPLEKIMTIARLYPSDETINRLGPILRTATLMIIRDNASVEDAVKQAIESLR